MRYKFIFKIRKICIFCYVFFGLLPLNDSFIKQWSVQTIPSNTWSLRDRFITSKILCLIKNDVGMLTPTFWAQYFIVPPSIINWQYFYHVSRLNLVLENGEKLLSSNVVLQFLQIYRWRWLVFPFLFKSKL